MEDTEIISIMKQVQNGRWKPEKTKMDIRTKIKEGVKRPVLGMMLKCILRFLSILGMMTIATR